MSLSLFDDYCDPPTHHPPSLSSRVISHHTTFQPSLSPLLWYPAPLFFCSHATELFHTAPMTPPPTRHFHLSTLRSHHLPIPGFSRLLDVMDRLALLKDPTFSAMLASHIRR